MKKISLLIGGVFLMAVFYSAKAQNAALGERIPEIKSEVWLGDVRPAAAQSTVIAFFTASSPACIKSLEQLYALSEKSGNRLRVIVITRDDEAKAASVTRQYLSPRFTVAFDTDGKLFKNFGVNYVPFGVLTDSRNRVIWQGNSLQLTEKIISTAR